MMLNIFIFAIIITCIAMMLSEGLWSNTLSLINTVIAAIIATNYFEPLAKFLDEQAPSYTYFWDFLSLWGLFALSVTVLRTATDQFSQTRVRFKKPVEQFGRIGVAAVTGWVVVCFFLLSLHTAPLVRNHFGGAFQKTPTSSNFFLSPDRLWLGFMQSRSQGALATSPPNVFDPQSEFILKYGARREQFSKMPTLRVGTGRRGPARPPLQ